MGTIKKSSLKIYTNELSFKGFVLRALMNIIFIIILSLLGFLLMSLAYSIPTDGRIKHNLEISSIFLESESNFQPVAGNKVLLDNYTEATMLLEAGAARVDNPFSDAMMNWHNDYPGVYQLDVFKDIYRNNNHDSSYSLSSYSRYWHGYLIWLKPLLLFMSYGNIRLLIAVISIMLLCSSVIMLAKINKGSVAVALCATYSCLAPFAIMMNMTLSCCFILGFLGINILLLLHKNSKDNYFNICMLFCILGALTSFFDLLTVPFLVCGINLLIYIAINNFSLKKSMHTIIITCFYWFMGFGLMWVMKLCIGSIICGTNLFESAISSFIERTANVVSADESASLVIPDNRLVAFKDTIYEQIFYLCNPVLLICVTAFLVIALIGILKSRKFLYKKALVYCIVAILPFVWYFATINHSIIHPRLTFRLMGVVLLAVYLFCCDCYRTKRKVVSSTINYF